MSNKGQSSNIKLNNMPINTPTNMMLPGNILLYIIFYSPMILVSLITFLSFVFQNFKGLIYLGFVLAAAVLRYFIYYISGSAKESNILRPNEDAICKVLVFSQYGNRTFSMFIFSFTMAYLFLPMFFNGYANYWIFSLLLFYGIVDFFVKINYNCMLSVSDIILNIIYGLFMGTVFVISMYSGGSQDYLFFNEMNTGANTCSKPKNQQFKCKVYKNGELIGSTASM